MFNIEAYWISPVGKIIEVEQRHIVASFVYNLRGIIL